MKRSSLIILLFLASILLSSCIASEANVVDKVVAPNNNMPPITGKWVAEELLMGDVEASDKLDAENFIGLEGLFHSEAVVLGEDYSINPSFRIKNVDTSEYFLYKYKMNPKDLGINHNKVQIITVLNDNQYFYEFIRYEENKLLAYINDNLYKMSKKVDQVSIEEVNRYIDVERTIARTTETLEVEKLQTGVLLGLKIPTYDEVNELSDWEYKTIWINSQDKNIVGLYQLDGLLVPRKNGFWVMDVEREEIKGSIIDKITGKPQYSNVENNKMVFDEERMLSSFEGLKEEPKVSSVLKNVQFVGNDYISVEKIENDNNNRQTLEIYAIDNIEEEKPIKLSDLIGEDGREIFMEGAQNILSLSTGAIPDETNVGVVRRNGYWIMKGRINYKQNNEELFKDFNIKTIPPKEMVSYDDLIIPWNIIKKQIPMALDAFSSPNNEFIVIETSSHLLIYTTVDGDLDINNPDARIKLPYNSSIIMSEWAVGRYSNIWENEVIKKGGNPIE